MNEYPSTDLSDLNYLDIKFNALESKHRVRRNVQFFYQNRHEDNNFKIQTLDQTLKQIYLSEVKGKTQHKSAWINWKK